MKILLDAREADSNTGTGNVIRNLYPHIIKQDSKNIYTIMYCDTDPFPKLKCNKILSPKKRGARFTYIWQLFGLSIFLNKNKFDVFFSFENFVYPIFFKKTSIICIQDLIPLTIDNYYDKLYDKIKYKIKIGSLKFIRSNTYISTVSDFSKKEIHKYLKIEKNKIHVVKHAICIDRAPLFSQKYLRKINIKKPYILAIGGGEKRKNNKTLVEVFNNLEIKEKLVIVGNINRNNSAAQFDKLDIKDKKKILTPGMVDDKTLRSLYKNATAFIFLSYYEGFGLPPLEAMSFSIPTLCSNRSSLPEVCKDGVLYTDPFNKEEIENKIKQIINDETLRKDLIIKGRKIVKSTSWDKSANSFIKLINIIDNARN
jgi:glycosyltransferase involved in cell wall biosynthesis